MQRPSLLAAQSLRTDCFDGALVFGQDHHLTMRFVPCCYGYATTIRRAQGCGFHHWCIYFDLKRKPAARGYGYVAVSRFTTKQGCYLYGKLRCTDFLPVGDEREDEVLERGLLSASSASDSEESMSGGMQYVGQSSLAGDIDEGMTSGEGEPIEGMVDDFA